MATYLDIKEKMINYIFDKLLFEFKMSHEKLVKIEDKKEKKIMMSRKKMR